MSKGLRAGFRSMEKAKANTKTVSGYGKTALRDFMNKMNNAASFMNLDPEKMKTPERQTYTFNPNSEGGSLFMDHQRRTNNLVDSDKTQEDFQTMLDAFRARQAQIIARRLRPGQSMFRSA